MLNTFLFDLDGTLLPQDQEQFINGYFKSVATHFCKLGYNPDVMIGAIWQGTKAMIKNNQEKTNEMAFWETFKTIIKGDYKILEETFFDYYLNKFDENKKYCFVNPKAKVCIDTLKNKGYQLVLATNPLFPKEATNLRIKWAGLDSSDFSLITTYEKSCACKPNLQYYQEILSNIHKKAEECIMIGNDVNEDMIVSKINMDTFLLTDCLINPLSVNIDHYHHGNFDDLYVFINSLPNLIN